MIPTAITSKQMPLLMMICAMIVAVVTLVAKYAQTTSAQRAIQQGSLPKLIAVLDRHPDQLNKPDQDNGFTPLHWAVMADQTNLVNYLLLKGANVNARDPYGMTPLHKAAAFNRRALAELLVARGADLRALGTKYSVIRVTPLHLAAEGGDPDLVAYFLDQGVDINIRTQGKNQVTPLHMAVGKGQAAVVELLLKAGADVNARDTQGKTPLRWALEAERKDVADMLKIFGGTE